MKTFTDFIEEIFERAEEEDERDKPDRNVVMQARKAVNMGNKDITFHDGKTHNVSRAHAQKFLNKHTSADRDNKLSIQNHAQQSHKNFMSHVGEDIDVEEGTGSKVCDQCENGKTENGSTCKSCSGTGYDMSSAKPATEANIVEISADRLSSYMSGVASAKHINKLNNKLEKDHFTGSNSADSHYKSYDLAYNKRFQKDKVKVPANPPVKEVTARSSGYGIKNKVSDMPGMDYSKRDNYSGRDAVKTAVKKANAQSDAKRAEYRNKMGMKEAVKEESEYGFGYNNKSTNHAEKGISSLKNSNLKVNHIGNSQHDSGNTSDSKPHNKPDVTIHYERGDKPHRDSPSGVTLHSSSAKSHNSATHFKNADQHMEEDKSSVAKEGSLTPVSKNNYAEQMAAYMKGLILKNNVSVEEKAGLWANIHAKRARGDTMREPGSKGAPTKADFKRSQ